MNESDNNKHSSSINEDIGQEELVDSSRRTETCFTTKIIQHFPNGVGIRISQCDVRPVQDCFVRAQQKRFTIILVAIR